MAKSLLQKAVGTNTKRKYGKVKIGEQTVELSLAWCKGEITIVQAATALGMKSGVQVYAVFANSLKHHINKKSNKSKK